MLAIAAVAFRTRVLPTWLAGLSALGVALLVPPIVYIAAIVFTFWCLVTGIVVYLRSSPAGGAEPAGGTAQVGLR